MISHIRQSISRTIWVKGNDSHVIQIIDQRYLPHKFVIEDLCAYDDTVRAIKEMHVRGAPLIGVTAAFGLYLAAREACGEDSFDAYIQKASERLIQARPTAVNLKWAANRVLEAVKAVRSQDGKVHAAFETAQRIAEEDVKICKKIGEHGSELIEELSKKKRGEAVNILTHCNAGWLACVEWGTATSSIYQAFDRGIKLHVWVDETRPRMQGASLTAWEMMQRGVPHTVIVDGASGHLMQRGLVDIVFVGADRTARSGDVANKIGTYMAALAAKENKVPFYVALPSSSIDWEINDGIKQIPIEERSSEEVTHIQGSCGGEIKKVQLTPEGSNAVNYAFDVTPRDLVTGLISERGICSASEESLLKLFPEKRASR